MKTREQARYDTNNEPSPLKDTGLSTPFLLPLSLYHSLDLDVALDSNEIWEKVLEGLSLCGRVLAINVLL